MKCLVSDEEEFPILPPSNGPPSPTQNFSCPPQYSTLPKSAPFETQGYNPASENSKSVHFKSGVNNLFIPGNEKTADVFQKIN